MPDEYIYIRSWGRWQSYRSDRGQPPWIKVWRRLNHDRAWLELSSAERGQLVDMWILAADRGGAIPNCAKTIKRLCNMTRKPILQRFVDAGFLTRDANVTPERRQRDANVTPERRQRDALVQSSSEKSSSESDSADAVDDDVADSLFSFWNECGMTGKDRPAESKNLICVAVSEHGEEAVRSAMRRYRDAKADTPVRFVLSLRSFLSPDSGYVEMYGDNGKLEARDVELMRNQIAGWRAQAKDFRRKGDDEAAAELERNVDAYELKRLGEKK